MAAPHLFTFRLLYLFMFTELDITTQALSSGLAGTALKQYNRASPWHSKAREASQYLYVLHVNSKGRATLWMRNQSNNEPAMYFSFNEKIGALQSTENDRTDVSMLSESEILCIQEARLQILEARLSGNLQT